MSTPWIRRYGIAVFLIVMAGAGRAAFAQTPTFAVEGVVTDSQQALLPGVTVTAQNVATGLTRVTTTDAGGRFVITIPETQVLP